MQGLSIIVPCYNEEKRLPAEKILSFLHAQPSVSLILVNDGSTDDTLSLLQTIRQSFPERVQIVSHEKKKGKGEAVRTGLLESTKTTSSTHHGFLDADLAISLEELYRLFDIINRSGKKFILGSRVKKIGANIVRNEWRHFYSRVIATIVGSIIKLDVYDTQCSAKIFHSEIVPSIFEDPFYTRWLFDVEVICRIHNRYGDLNAAGSEEPVLEWIEKKGSKLRWYNFFQIVNEVFILRKHYREKR